MKTSRREYLRAASAIAFSSLAARWPVSLPFGDASQSTLRAAAASAGLVYGFTWRKTGNIFASALVHTAVDAIWHMLFI